MKCDREEKTVECKPCNDSTAHALSLVDFTLSYGENKRNANNAEVTILMSLHQKKEEKKKLIRV